jgi:hypothetical protein
VGFGMGNVGNVWRWGLDGEMRDIGRVVASFCGRGVESSTFLEATVIERGMWIWDLGVSRRCGCELSAQGQ